MSTSTDGAPPVPRHMQRDRFAPVPETQAARDEAGLIAIRTGFGTPARLVTRYADVREVLGDAERFTNTGLPRLPMPEDGIDPRAGNLLATDPPEHTRLRRLLTGEFTVKRIRRLEPRIVEIVDDHLDAMAAAGPPADLVSVFALPVPSLVICELLGVPYDDRAEFQGRAARQVDLSLPLEERGRVAAESRTYMGELVDRARTEPGDDMLGMLVREHGDDLARSELIGIASLLLIAGHETTANMLGLGTLALLRAPEQLALVRDEPGAVAPAIEELLRFLSVVHSGIPRTVRHDTTVGDVPVAAGEVLVLSLPAANRDPAAVEHPDDLDVTRTIAPHVAFGHGVHHCLGAPLARAEMAVAFPALFRRFPTLAPGIPFEEIEFRSATIVHGLRALPVTW
ncbi:cytochrome P450 [Actinomycetospora callitridis]|uniref:cytochrome P450 n=1 Tax=Actinomycetospora callitridis TaxID=913944 RepID=UPI00236578DF|nr:cytochrome P450 [Actinomycetospora callitridis]MDD7919408.1 cytochrome P450 [Actinomycetospora callitridis]